MISYGIDGVLLLALLLTTLRVGSMYRELKRLRGYQSQYVEVFDATSRAAGEIGAAVRHLGSEGRDVLERLELGIAEARELARRIEATRAPGALPRVENAGEDDFGSYTWKAATEGFAAESDPAGLRNEILKIAGDNRRIQDRRDEGAAGPPSFQPRPGREFRLAPSVKTLRVASGG